MERSRLLGVLQTCTNKELKLLGRWLASPFFNRNEVVEKLLEYILECDDLGVKPEKEAFYDRVFPGKAYSDHQVRLWMSYLLKQTEAFLSYQSFSEEENNKIRLAGIYRQRGLEKHFNQTYRQAQKTREKRPYRNAEFYRSDYHLQLELYQYQSGKRRTRELNLQEIADSLDKSYLAEKLRLSCTQLSHQAVYKTDYDHGVLDALLEVVATDSYLEVPAIAVYYYCLRFLRDPEATQYFLHFKSLLLNEQKLFPPDEIRDLLILGINYCIKRYNKGDEAFLEEEFDLYKLGLEGGFLLQDGYLSPHTFRNIVTLGLVMQVYDWVADFLERYKNDLPPSQRAAIYGFCLARLAYSRGQRERALELLPQAEYKDVFLTLASKTLQFKLFYELEAFDLLHAHLEAMRAFIRRKPALAYHRDNYLNAIQFTRKLMDVNPYDRTATAALRQEIESTQVLAEKKWLLEQLNRT